MAQVSKYFTQKDVTEYIQNMFPFIVADLGDRETVDAFLDDFFSQVELSIFSKRLVIALMIVKGYSQEVVTDTLIL